MDKIADGEVVDRQRTQEMYDNAINKEPKKGQGMFKRTGHIQNHHGRKEKESPAFCQFGLGQARNGM
jgi:hypothetical protein